MGLFFKTMFIYFLGFTQWKQAFYVPLHLIYLEIKFPGMIASMVDERNFQEWISGYQLSIVLSLLLFGIVYLWARLLLPTGKSLFHRVFT